MADEAEGPEFVFNAGGFELDAAPDWAQTQQTNG